MAAVTHILDTSALLAHYFQEPGADQVQALWEDRAARPGICAVTVTELRGRLAEEIARASDVAAAVEGYLGELTVCLPVDRVVAEAASQLRAAASGRLPLVDALIAGAARTANAILVHKDPHMAGIPADLVKQMVLGAPQL